MHSSIYRSRAKVMPVDDCKLTSGSLRRSLVVDTRTRENSDREKPTRPHAREKVPIEAAGSTGVWMLR